MNFQVGIGMVISRKDMTKLAMESFTVCIIPPIHGA
jgi:hypothetical protein